MGVYIIRFSLFPCSLTRLVAGLTSPTLSTDAHEGRLSSGTTGVYATAFISARVAPAWT